MQKRRRPTSEGFGQQTPRGGKRALPLTRVATIALTIAVLVICGFGIWFAKLAFWQQPNDTAKPAAFSVDPGSGVRDIADSLHADGFIDHPSFFLLYLRLSKSGNQIQAGQFSLKPGMNYRALTQALSSAGVREVRVTIPEGYTARQIGNTVQNAFPGIESDDWQNAVGADSPLKVEMGVLSKVPPNADLEGYLFPDTYRFRADATAEDVTRRMVNNFVRRMSEINVDVSGGDAPTDSFSLHEFITLASIVEREVQRPEDMKSVADIFIKRLGAGMMLQADSTVNYVIGGDDPSLTLEQTKIDSPYNTYKYTGLPPGPISNPGLNALNAVLTPDSNEWYYFLTTPEGEVKYAKTFSKHIQNKNQYLD